MDMNLVCNTDLTMPGQVGAAPPPADRQVRVPEGHEVERRRGRVPGEEPRASTPPPSSTWTLTAPPSPTTRRPPLVYYRRRSAPRVPWPARAWWTPRRWGGRSPCRQPLPSPSHPGESAEQSDQPDGGARLQRGGAAGGLLQGRGCVQHGHRAHGRIVVPPPSQAPPAPARPQQTVVVPGRTVVVAGQDTRGANKPQQ